MTKTEIIAALNQPVECGCGDIRTLIEFCEKCGKCNLGCCMCEFNNFHGTETA